LLLLGETNERCAIVKREERRREENIRRHAKRLGLYVTKLRAGHDAGRYWIREPSENIAMPSHNPAWPNSFDLGEAETFLAARSEA
jgi:hypothetical protein